MVVLMGILAIILVGGGAYRLGFFTKDSHIAGTRIVVFDPIKFGNAQRAVASSFMATNNPDVDEQVLLFKQASSRLRATITAVAGNAVVVVKQSIISGETEDITDRVLLELGLPTNVPSVDLARTLSEIAPTDYTFNILNEVQTQRQAAKTAQAKAIADQAKASAVSKVVP